MPRSKAATQRYALAKKTALQAASLVEPTIEATAPQRISDLKTILCPNCNKPTALLWLKLNLPSLPALCKTCFNHHKAVKDIYPLQYRVYFLPSVIKDGNSWTLSHKRNFTFNDLSKFITHCLDSTDEEVSNSNTITRDMNILSKLTSILFDILIELKPMPFYSFCSSLNMMRNTQYDHLLYQKYIKNMKEEIAASHKIAHQLQRRIEEIIHKDDQKLTSYENATKIAWRLLPPGELPFAKISEHFSKLQKSDPNTDYDLQRLHLIYKLSPDNIYIGDDEFRGYVAFYFQSSKMAVLECPVVGNAIYVIKGDWRNLSKRSKAELLWFYSDKVTRIIHTGNWFSKLKTAIHHD